MAYSLSNKCAQNFCSLTVLVQIIVIEDVTYFWTQCNC